MLKRLQKLIRMIKRWDELMGKVGAIEADNLLLRSQLNALQAIDESYHTPGKIIILASIGGQDRVKIIDIQRKITTVEYMNTVAKLEETYGAKPQYVDSRIPSFDWLGDYNRRRR